MGRHCKGLARTGFLVWVLSAISAESAPVYYSVGTSVADLKNGAPTVTIAAGVATFSTAQNSNVGVGDEITYNGATKAYISGRTSAAVFSVTTATGAVPPNVAGATVNSIRRAFNSLNAANAGSSNASHLNATDLVAAGVELHWACYNDGPMNDVLSVWAGVQVAGYTTGAANYIRIFAPDLPSEVGTSQRHRGVAGTGFRLVPTQATPAFFFAILDIDVPHIRIEGIEVDGSGITNGEEINAVHVFGITTAGSDLRLEAVLIHDLTNTTIDDSDSSMVKGIAIHHGNLRLSNSIVYGLTNVSTNSGSMAMGVELNAIGATHFAHNNTIFDVKQTAAAGGAWAVGLVDWNGTTTARSNFVGDVLSTSGTESCYWTIATQSNNVSSDASAAGAGSVGGQTSYGSYFVSVTTGSEDFHLRGDSLSLWTTVGADLDSDANLPVVEDVDGAPRDATAPDVGADEFVRELFYSVGTSASDLKTGSPAISIASGTATLSLAQTGNVGLGDEIDYGAGSKAYIYAVTSPTVFVVRTASGMVPADTGAVSVNSIRRAFNTWAAAIAGTGTASYLNTFDLVAAGVRVTWVGYNDGPFNVAGTTNVTGYVTDAAHYLRATVAGASDVASGTSQRHTGLAGTGTRLVASAGGITLIRVDEAFTQVEWLELDGNSMVTSRGLQATANASGSRLQKVIVHHTRGDTNTGSGIFIDSGSSSVEVRNAVIYDYDGDGVHVSGDGARIYASTIHRGNTTPASNSVQTDNNATALVENVLAIGPETDFWENLPGALTLNNCISSDSSADDFLGSGNIVNADPNVQFVSIAGAIDLHLVAGSDAIDAGKDLSGLFADDIDGEARPQGAQWEVGADETSATAAMPRYRSVGVNVLDLTAGGLTVQIAGTTATFSGAVPANVGVGDVLQYQVAATFYVAFIHGRSSSTVYSVRSFTGGTPQAAAAGTGVSVFRAYTSLFNWEAQNENDSLNNTVENFDTSTNLVTAGATMQVACYGDGADSTPVTISGWSTSAENYIRIFAPESLAEVGARQRHNGVWDPTKYVVQSPSDVLTIASNFVRFEGLQVHMNADTADASALYFTGGSGLSEYHVSHSLIRGNGNGSADIRIGINTFMTGSGAIKVWNNVIYDFDGGSNAVAGVLPDDSNVTWYLYNNTIIHCRVGVDISAGTVVAKNNLVYDNSFDNYWGGFDPASTNNLSGPIQVDAPGSNPRNGAAVIFVNEAADDFHLALADLGAKDFGVDLSGDASLAFSRDIDGGLRQTPWDIGADDIAAATAVDLLHFDAMPLDGAVELQWETGAEMENLGFHLYRATEGSDLFERVTASVIAGLGSSPAGAKYAYRDKGLENGTTYLYLLEDIETSGRTTRHGPVSATPLAGLPGGEDAGSGIVTYGEPESSSFRVIELGRRRALVELVTGGFYAVPQPDGSVAIEIPGFEPYGSVGLPAIPVKRPWIDARAELGVRISSVSTESVLVFEGISIAAEGGAETVASSSGAVRAERRSRARHKSAGRFPESRASLLGIGYQGPTKKARLELAPLRWDPSTGRLALARRLLVEVSFAGRETDGAGRRSARTARGRILARLATVHEGLHRVRHGDVLGARQSLPVDRLRLSRLGEAVPFHVEPDTGTFGPGSILYFVSGGASANPYGLEALYELEESPEGTLRMEREDGSPDGNDAGAYVKRAAYEENRLYQAGLPSAPDLWLWESFVAPASKTFVFSTEHLRLEEENARLRIWLQGTSDFASDPDHHLRALVNGVFVAESFWDGKKDVVLEAEVPLAALREGTNQLELLALNDTGADYSMWMLNRFEIEYPRAAEAESGRLEGRWTRTGTARVSGLGAAAIVVDATDGAPRWIAGVLEGGDGTVRFRAEENRRYLIAATDAVHAPVVRRPRATGLRSESRGADYVAIGPRAFLEQARPLLDHRRREGLRVAAVSVEDVYEEFGHGEARPEAIAEFLKFAYANWRRPSLRYVLLLGDATYDFKDYLGTGVRNQVPPLLLKTQALWTASDPAFAAVNGEDFLPDVAIGRLPAASEAEERALVEKTLAFERTFAMDRERLSGALILVADDPDRAGDFGQNQDAIAKTVLADRDVRKLYLEDLGSERLRQAIKAAFDDGPSLVSYAGHGGIHLWANENVFDIGAVPDLLSQSRQPLVVTLNCLNGYFHFPYFDSLAEALVKAEGKGAIAAISPSGMSFDAPAHEFHGVLLDAVFHGGHQRLGDAVLAAQASYAASGAWTELLSLYHLFGDPALRLR